MENTLKDHIRIHENCLKAAIRYAITDYEEATGYEVINIHIERIGTGNETTTSPYIIIVTKT